MFFRLVMATMLLIGASSGQVFAQQIDLNPKQIKRIGITTSAAEVAKTLNLTTIPGRITAPLHTRVAVAVPFAGTILSVDVLEGAKTEQNKPLLTIASSEYLNAQTELLQHETEFRVAQASAERLRKLASEGIVAEARAELAEANAAQIKVALAALRSRLSYTEPTPKQAGTYSLMAQDGGTVATLAINPGDPVEALQTVIVLQASDQVWLEASLPAAMTKLVQVGDKVAATPGDIQGKVIAVGLNVDPVSRSVMLRANIDKKNGARPGQNVLATIIGQAPPGALVIPRAALVRLDGNYVVFVAKGGGFQIVAADILSRGPDKATIVAPISAGDQLAVSGLAELKALAQQGQ